MSKRSEIQTVRGDMGCETYLFVVQKLDSREYDILAYTALPFTQAIDLIVRGRMGNHCCHGTCDYLCCTHCERQILFRFFFQVETDSGEPSLI